MGIMYKYDDPKKSKQKQQSTLRQEDVIKGMKNFKNEGLTDMYSGIARGAQAVAPNNSGFTKKQADMFQKASIVAKKSGLTEEEIKMYQKALIEDMQEENHSLNNNKTMRAVSSPKDNNNPYYLFNTNNNALKKSNGSLNNNITEGMNAATDEITNQLLKRELLDRSFKMSNLSNDERMKFDQFEKLIKSNNSRKKII
jgi:hypothetical protein